MNGNTFASGVFKGDIYKAIYMKKRIISRIIFVSFFTMTLFLQGHSTLTVSQALDSDLFYYQWEGKIKNQEVHLACARQDKVLIGELMLKDGTNMEFLRVLGMIDADGEILFKAYDLNNICVVRMTFWDISQGKRWSGSMKKLNPNISSIPIKEMSAMP